MNYAGFWKRFGALLIDVILLGCVQWIVLTPILVSMGVVTDMSNMASGDGDPMAAMSKMMSIFSVSSMIGWVVNILYFSFMESSKYQATLGKMALGIKVVDLGGQNGYHQGTNPERRKNNFRDDFGYWLYHGGIHRKETGPPRYDCWDIGGGQIVHLLFSPL
jgi:hypothetical protein